MIPNHKARRAKHFREDTIAYAADISRNNPACFLFLIDQSGSMTQALAGQPGQRKMDGAADAVNRSLDAISQRCSQGLDIRDYFHIGILGYSTDAMGNAQMESILQGTSSGPPFLPISEVVELAEVEEREVEESDGAGGLVQVTRRLPFWLRPRAEYGTPMCETLDNAGDALEAWIADHPDSYPPTVINISDGMATDGDPVPFAERITNLSTSDGEALLFNCHISSINAMPCEYPGGVGEVPLDDEFAPLMFRMSSPLPAHSSERALGLDLSVSEDSRGYVFNADMRALVQFLDIGTRAASNLL